jgi:pimeloyl-ACP methyl ester carboxylesterase
MKTIIGSTGAAISYTVGGSGPALVLVHGSFSDHDANWTFVAPLFQRHFRVYAIARRGRGMTTASEGHTIEDEAQDVVDVVQSIGEPVALLGHSYGAHCALLAAVLLPTRIRKLVLYEPIWPHMLRPDAFAALEVLAAAGAWDQFAFAFFANTLHVPGDALDRVRASEELWSPIVADARATLGDLRALRAYRFEPHRFARSASGSGARRSPASRCAGSWHVNPFRRTEDADRLARGLRQAGLAADPDEGRPEAVARPGTPDNGQATFRREGVLWAIAFGGSAVQLTHQKGFVDLAQLLARPGTEMHCLELADRPAETGRSRHLGSGAERARSAVTWRIRNAIRKIASAHPRLGRHLDNAVRTGTFCVYEPEAPVDWVL